MGRRKIQMEQVQDTNTRQVTFSKRRTGLFKKASELAILCNADVSIIAFSPGEKPFSYGKPSVEAVVERFNKDCEDSESDDEDIAQRNDEQEKMIENLNCLTKELEAKKKRGEMLQQQLESVGDERFLKPVEELSLVELKEYKAALQTMHDKIKGKATQMQASSSLMLLSSDNGSAKEDDAKEDDDN